MKDEHHPKDCFHCAVIELIRERYPHGVDKFAAGRILGSLASVSGDLLSHGSEESFEGFCEIVYREAIQPRRRVLYLYQPVN